jgi:flagellar biosynthesis protein FlhA
MVIIINIVGGLVVGIVQHDLAFADAVKNYTMLAIGDGLVAQIPSLIISVAAGEKHSHCCQLARAGNIAIFPSVF